MTLNEKYNIPNDTIITIGGMVGIGKSTITNSLADALNFRTDMLSSAVVVVGLALVAYANASGTDGLLLTADAWAALRAPASPA